MAAEVRAIVQGVKNRYNSNMKFDHLLFGKINSLAGKSNVADWIMIFGARYLIVVMAASLLKYVFIYKNKAERLVNLRVVWNAFFSAGLGLLFNYFLSFFIHRLRPFDIGLGENIYGSVFTSGSFPSEHATIAFAFAMAVFMVYKKFGAVLLVTAAFIGFSRVYVGIHYPFDILGGAFVGILMAYLVSQFITPKIFKFGGQIQKKV